MAAHDALRSIRVGDIMIRDFETVRLDETLSRALGRLERGGGAVVVVDESGNYAGILTERMALRTLSDPSTTKVRSLYRKAPRVSPEDDLIRAARLMVENDLSHLPVTSDGALVGVVRDVDVMKAAVGTGFGGTRVSEVMTSDPVWVEDEETAARALALMRREGVFRLPVLHRGRVVGMFTIRDVIEKVLRPRGGIQEGGAGPLDRRVADLMSRDVASVLPDDDLRRAADLMIQRDIASVIVVDGAGRLRGLLTRSDILRRIVHVGEEGAPIIVQFSVKDPEEFDNVELDRDKLRSMIDGFLRKYREFLGPAHAVIYLKRHRERRRGRRLTHCRVQVYSPRGIFTGIGEGWGLNQAVRTALDNAARHVERAKEGTKADRAIIEEILEML